MSADLITEVVDEVIHGEESDLDTVVASVVDEKSTSPLLFLSKSIVEPSFSSLPAYTNVSNLGPNYVLNATKKIFHLHLDNWKIFKKKISDSRKHNKGKL